MGKNNILINLSNISFSYPSKMNLLNDLSFTLRAGDRVGIIGPNGCGKTTLFYVIMGLMQPYEGHVEICGKIRIEEADFREVREKIGFLFQNSDDQLFCPSVREEVSFGPLNFGIDREEVKNAVKETLIDVGLEGFEVRPPYDLSGGEKRKLALATILALKPKILLLDEPTIGLDEETVEKIIEILKEPDLSYIIISQNREFLKTTTDILYTINNGKMREMNI